MSQADSHDMSNNTHKNNVLMEDDEHLYNDPDFDDPSVSVLSHESFNSASVMSSLYQADQESIITRNKRKQLKLYNKGYETESPLIRPLLFRDAREVTNENKMMVPNLPKFYEHDERDENQETWWSTDTNTELSSLDGARGRKNEDIEGYRRASEIANKLPKPIRYRGIPEASAYILFVIGQGMAAASSLYFSIALLELGDEVAGCKDDNDDDNDCEEKVWGLLKPTSLISTIAICVSFFGALMMPVVGSIIDHTPHRKLVGQRAAYFLIVLAAVQISVCEDTFEVMVGCFILFGFAYTIHSTTAGAYLPDLDFDYKRMGEFSALFNCIELATMILFGGLVLVLSSVLDKGDVGTATLSQSILVAGLLIVWLFAWHFLFTDRPALHNLEEGKSVYTSGFTMVKSTLLDMHQNHPNLRLFWISLALSQSATGALTAVSTTYMDDELEMTNAEISAAFVVVLLFAIPGTFLSRTFNRAFNPLRSYRLCVILFLSNTLLAAIVLQDEDTKNYVYIFCAVWGVLYGWKPCAEVTVYITIIPRGRETEMMGIKSLAGGAFIWLPALIFTIMNECDIPLRWCLASLCIFLAMSFVVSRYMDSYESIVDKVKAKNGEESSEEENLKGGNSLLVTMATYTFF